MYLTKPYILNKWALFQVLFYLQAQDVYSDDKNLIIKQVK